MSKSPHPLNDSRHTHLKRETSALPSRGHHGAGFRAKAAIVAGVVTKLLLMLLLPMALIGATTTNALAAAGGSALYPGETLYDGQSLVDGQYTMSMQTDGNFVLYNGTRALWQSGTYGRGGAWISMQGDGNLVIYNSSNQPLWQSGTAGHGGSRLEVQSDGNAVVYTSDNQWLWATNTAVQGNSLPSGARDIGYNPFAAHYGNQCTYYAEERMHSQTGRYMPVYGNAYQWATQAAAGGWTVGTTPATNSVAVFPAGAFGSSVGHVAWVIAVGSGTLEIQDYNWNHSGAHLTTHSVQVPRGTQFIYSDR